MKPIRCRPSCRSLLPVLILALALALSGLAAASGQAPRGTPAPQANPAQASLSSMRIGETGSFTFFESTQYPLTVYFLRGPEPGPTVMVQGGIQGDETSGFITAQLLTRAKVQKGTLIIVPRANAPSIHQRKRLINVDLNRRFDRDYNQFYEDRLARAIRFLIGQSDAFIHLHEGSGFYSPTYVSPNRNPNRYGQSVIIDTLVYNDRLFLADAVNKVLDRLNQSIPQPENHFHLFNTDTFSSGSAYAEQRRSLTCYALQARGIPALAIEVSKSIHSLAWKVRHQLLATGLFLDQFGLGVTMPEVDADLDLFPKSEPRITINGQSLKLSKTAAQDTRPVVVAPYTRLKISVEGREPFDTMGSVFASDREGVNLVSTPFIPLHSFQALEFRIDGENMGRVPLAWKDAWPKAGKPGNGDKPVFAVWLNGELRKVPADSTLEARLGDQLILEGIWGSKDKEILNFKGFVSQPGKTGPGANQDLGQEIILDPDNILARYRGSAAGEPGWSCTVIRETPGRTKSSFNVHISPRQVEGVRLRNGQGGQVHLAWAPGSSCTLPPGDYTLEDVTGNGPRDKILVMLGNRPLRYQERFSLEDSGVLSLRLATTFHPLGQMTLDTRGALAQAATRTLQ